MPRSLPILLLLLLAAIPTSICRGQYVMTLVAEGASRLTFIDDRQGMAYGDGRIMYTGDAGHTWSTMVSDVRAATGCDGISGCSFVNRRAGWIVGYGTDPDSSFLCGTTDGGVTWTRLRASPISSIAYASHRFAATQFVDEMNGWVVGKGIIEHTSDGGESWTTQLILPEQPGNNDWFDCCRFLNAREGWVAGFGSFILHTSDGGITWGTQHVDSEAIDGIIRDIDYYYIYGIDFSDSLNGVASANNGHYLRTTDGGRNWLPSSTRFPNDNVGVQVVDENEIWQVGGNYCDDRGCFSGESILHSRDGGRNWIAVRSRTIGPLGAGAQFGGVHFISPRLGYVANELGEIFRIEDTSAVAAGVDDASGPSVLPLVSPQPARDELRVDLPVGPGDRSLNVYDIDGRRVLAVPVGRAASATIATRGLAPGVYVLEVLPASPPVRRRFVIAR